MQKGRHRRMRGFKSRRPNHPRSYQIVCTGCGKEFLIPERLECLKK